MCVTAVAIAAALSCRLTHCHTRASSSLCWCVRFLKSPRLLCVDLSTTLAVRVIQLHAKDVEGESLSDLLYVYALRDDRSAAVLQVQAEGV